MAHVLSSFPALSDISLQVALAGTALAWPALSILKHIFGTLHSQVHSQNAAEHQCACYSSLA